MGRTAFEAKKRKIMRSCYHGCNSHCCTHGKQRGKQRNCLNCWGQAEFSLGQNPVIPLSFFPSLLYLLEKVNIWCFFSCCSLFFIKVCLCRFFSVQSPSLMIRLLPPTLTLIPSVGGGCLHGGISLPCFWGGRGAHGAESACVCFFSMLLL